MFDTNGLSRQASRMTSRSFWRFRSLRARGRAAPPRPHVLVGLERRVDRNEIVVAADLDAVAGKIDHGPVRLFRFPLERTQRRDHAVAR